MIVEQLPLLSICHYSVFGNSHLESDILELHQALHSYIRECILLR